MFTTIIAVGWIPVVIGLHFFFKWKEKRDMEEAMCEGFKVLLDNPEYLRKVLGVKK